MALTFFVGIAPRVSGVELLPPTAYFLTFSQTRFQAMRWTSCRYQYAVLRDFDISRSISLPYLKEALARAHCLPTYPGNTWIGRGNGRSTTPSGGRALVIFRLATGSTLSPTSNWVVRSTDQSRVMNSSIVISMNGLCET